MADTKLKAKKEPVIMANCYNCGDCWDEDFMIDDAPRGFLCWPCDDTNPHIFSEDTGDIILEES